MITRQNSFALAVPLFQDLDLVKDGLRLHAGEVWAKITSGRLAAATALEQCALDSHEICDCSAKFFKAILFCQWLSTLKM